MTTYHVFPLRFNNTLHLSRGRENNYDKTQAVLHSDTLKSALFVTAMEVANAAELPDKSFFELLKISSVFPYYKAANTEKAIYFLPRPLLPAFHKKLRIQGIGEYKQRKVIKNLEYLESSLLLELLQKEVVFIDKNNISQDGAFASHHTPLSELSLLNTSPQQHVSVDRLFETDAKPFYIDRLYFSEGVGFYFLMEGNYEDRRKILRLLEVLGENGLGTDKSVGGGHFKVDEKLLDDFLELSDTGNHQINLSLYCPNIDNQEELSQLEDSYYELVKRGGFIASPAKSAHASLRKRSVYMFKEGSIFPFKATRTGQIVDLKPDEKRLKDSIGAVIEHSIWRDGRSIFLAY